MTGGQTLARDAVADIATPPPLKRDRRVHAWIVSDAVSQVGDAAWYVGLAWSAAQVTTAAGAGLIMGIGAAPRALVLLLGGALADRLDARRTLVLANLARIAVLVVGTAVVLVAGPSVPLLLTVAAVFGIVDAIYQPASTTLPRQMVREGDLTSVAAMSQLASRLAIFVGGPLGGLLVAAGGLAAVMAADAVSFAVIALVLAAVVRPRFPRPPFAGGSLRSQLWDGFRYLRRATRARTLVTSMFGLNLCVGPVLAVGLALRTHSEGWGAASLGLFSACSGIAAAAGAIMAMRWKPHNQARAAMVVLLFQAAACIAIGALPHAGMFAAMTVIGLTAGLASAQLSGAFQLMIDRSYLGRIGSIVRLSDEALMPIVMTGFGAFAGVAGIKLACAVVGAAFAGLMTWSVARLR